MAERVPTYCRMDFSFEALSMNEETREVQFRIAPDPRRYDRVKREGTTHYLDKYLNTLISEEVLKESMLRSAGVPIYAGMPHIENALEYASSRKEAVEQELGSGSHVPPNSKADAHRALGAEETLRNFTFLIVDICNSTRLRATHPEGFDRAYKIVVQELGSVVGQFHGTLLKLTGDGFIAYLDGPSINVQSDNAIDMGLTFLTVLAAGVNPALAAEGLPEISIRVTADHGIGSVTEFTVPITGFSIVDVASDALNRCAKIQGSAGANQFLVGRELYERMHVQWLERSQELDVDIGRQIGLDKYEIYAVS